MGVTDLYDLNRPAGPSWRPAGANWTLGTTGIGWVLYVPHGDNSAVQVRRDQQEPVPPVPADDGLRWHWPSVVDEAGRALDIAVTVTMSTCPGELRLRLTVDNQSDSTVDSALFPWVRGLDLPDDRVLTGLTRDYYGARERPLWPTFEWNKGYYGTVRPTAMTDSLVFGNPTAPFAVMQDGIEAVAAWVVGPTPEIVGWLWELEPGYADTIGDRAPWPGSAAPEGQLWFSGVHLLDLAPGGTRELARINLTHAEGGWQAALAGYRRHRWQVVDREPSPPMPDWADRPHSWYQVGLNTPVGERRYRFDDLPGMARECADAGVDVLHVIGWNDGGQDRNNPCHDPDPALGGAAGLADAVAACQALGVRVVLFTKFTWADLATPRFREELHRSAVRDPYGDHYRSTGYQYLTPHQLMDVSTRRLVPMCFLHEEYLRVCEREFDKVVATGADGMLYDETMHHTPALQCYATDHGHEVGASVYGGDAPLAARLRARLPRERADFLFAGETVYEDLQSQYQLSYIRSHYLNHQPLTRYLNPRLRMMTTVSGFDDRNQINQAVVYGYLLCYEPRHFKGRLADFPSTVDYGRAAQRLRTELADYLWHGTFERAGELAVPGSGPVPLRTAQWRHTNGRDRLTALANYNQSAVPLPIAELGITELRGVEGPWRPVDGPAEVPARGLVVVR